MRHRISGILTLALTSIFIACSGSGVTKKASIDTVAVARHSPHWQTVDGEPMLIGDITRDELFSEFEIFQINFKAYIPNDAALELLKNVEDRIHVDAFLGTWCGDSKRNLSDFLKVVDQSGNPNFTITMHSMDRSKKDKEGLAIKNTITKVPTIIFYRDGKEIGRIVEAPVKSIEEDMLSFLHP
jgi:hypothetical protein